MLALAPHGLHAQTAASTYPAVRLQSNTPGTTQVGHAHIDGTLRSGSLRTDWFRLTSSSTAGFVLTTDDSGIGTWQPAIASGLVLPFAGSASSPDPVFDIDNTGAGPAIRGEGSGQTGDLGSVLAGVFGLGGTGVLGSGTVNGVRGESAGGIAVYGLETISANVGELGTPGFGAYGLHGGTGNFGYLGDFLDGAYGQSATPGGAGVYGISLDPGGPSAGVHGTSTSTAPTAAGVRGTGSGASGPGLPNAAAVQVDNGAITVSGPLLTRASGSIVVPGPWAPIMSCNNVAVVPPHFHPIGYSADVVLLNDLILPGPPNVGSMIMATVETFPGPPPAKTSYYVQVYAKVAGSVTFRVTRMGTPDPPGCPVPGEINYVHYTIINPL